MKKFRFQTHTFIPTQIIGSKSFNGLGYVIGYLDSRYHYLPDKVKVWDPVNKKVVVVLAEYSHEYEDQLSDELLERAKNDFAEYKKYIINRTLAWCRTKIDDENEARKFARACLFKRYSLMAEDIDKLIPDTRNVKDEIQNAFKYVSQLSKKNKATYDRDQILDLAFKHLTRYRVNFLEGFKEAWDEIIAKNELPNS